MASPMPRMIPEDPDNVTRAEWKPAMADLSLENLNLRNSFFCVLYNKKLHDKITTDYTMLMGLCKKHQDKYGFDT